MTNEEKLLQLYECIDKNYTIVDALNDGFKIREVERVRNINIIRLILARERDVFMSCVFTARNTIEEELWINYVSIHNVRVNKKYRRIDKDFICERCADVF